MHTDDVVLRRLALWRRQKDVLLVVGLHSNFPPVMLYGVEQAALTKCQLAALVIDLL